MKTIESILEKYSVVADVDYEVIVEEIITSIISENDIDRIQFMFNELIRKGKHNGKETFFRDVSIMLTKLRSFL